MHAGHLCAQDWEGMQIAIFENQQDCWVVKIDLSTVESLEGLLAYMNVFVRCNKLVNQYGLTKVCTGCAAQIRGACCFCATCWK